ncbi:MAG: TauD/TfdA dioxygenase family protein, partial [Rhabdochlamydiaceae bacterium]
NRLIVLFLVMAFSNISAMIVRPLSEKMGVEVTGLDLSNGIEPEEVNTIKALLLERFFVVIRDQHFTPQQQARISRAFGDIEVAWNNKNRHPEDPCIYLITNEIQKKNPQYKSPTFFWHWDKNFVRYPTSVSFAFFDSAPQPEGMGMTRFANLNLAYDELLPDLKKRIESLYVVHSYDHMSNAREKNYENVSMIFQRGEERFSDVLHPVVRIHPLTAKRNFNVDELYQAKIIGISSEEDLLLRKALLEHATQEKYLYTHTWKKGDFGMWDNLALLHQGTPSDPNISRVLRRSSISSRGDIEGRVFLVGVEEGTLNLLAFSGHLFADPIFIDSDSYADLSSLGQDVKNLRKGSSPHTEISPHAILVLKGSQWEQSRWICSILDAAIVSSGNKGIFSKRVHLISSSSSLTEIVSNLQEISLDKFLVQEAHERMNNGELADEYLSKVEKIFIQSFETYYDTTSQSFYPSRKKLHGEILQAVLKNRKNVPTLDQNKPWFLSLYGPSNAADPFLEKLQRGMVVDNRSIVIDSQLFINHLFNDIPYEHKLKLFPCIKKEIVSLLPSIVKMALSNGLNVVLSIPFLPDDVYRQLTEIAEESGGESVMVAFHPSLDRCYQFLIKKEDRERYIYDQLTQLKVCSSHWSQLISNFSATFLVDVSDNVVFLSGKGVHSIVSWQGLEQFLSYAYIDVDKLSQELTLHDAKERVQLFDKYLSLIPSEQTQKLIPLGSQFVNPSLTLSTSSLAQQLQQILQRSSS